MTEVIDHELDMPGFSIRTGHHLAWASNYAYEELGDWVGRLGLGRDTTAFNCGQFRGFVGSLDKNAVVAFRGTQNVGNCLTDLETPLITHAAYPGRVHHGFADAVDRVWPEVLRLLGHPSQAMPLWVTGHSLGGAMATLASVRLAEYGYQVRGVYTYGAPRVGDRLFRQFYGLANFRFVNDNDLVPHLPFRWCYKHVGQLKLLDHEGNLIDEKSAWVNKKRALARKAKLVQRAHRGLAKARHEFAEFDWLSDHRLEEYLAAIARIIPRVPRRRLDGPHGRLSRIAIHELVGTHTPPSPAGVAGQLEQKERERPLPRLVPRAEEKGELDIIALELAPPDILPHLKQQGERGAPLVTEADLIEAFSRQPPARGS